MPGRDQNIPKAQAAPRNGLARWLYAALFLITFDQLTKIGFDHALTYGQRVNVLPFFDFTLLYNKGAAFSFLADQPGWQRWIFTAIGLGASIFIIWLMHTHRSQHRFMLALTLILGGALGNVIDRMSYGHVVDFLLFYWHPWYYPAFNVADMGITIGAILLVIDEILRLRGQRAKSS